MKTYLKKKKKIPVYMKMLDPLKRGSFTARPFVAPLLLSKSGLKK